MAVSPKRTDKLERSAILLRKLQAHAGFKSQKAAYEWLRVPRQTYWNYVHGRQETPWPIMLALAGRALVEQGKDPGEAFSKLLGP
ncbi:hypothetical protein E3E12_00015 [Formicincola oecophyllae]|uniref:XRE family transcriptional regulator n=1 Tax=Formicincola oecophyllae TaxID=2558361 RepID=A0A4Y6U9P1_9PROT|nr:hypothetical protein [Formicincola oecophyllae]QDH12855.2 hypothetical protein E3E12_00015 [Formicincola oecophyllae]